MKIEINVDIESIVRDEIRSYVRENITINNVAATIVAVDAEVAPEDAVNVTIESTATEPTEATEQAESPTTTVRWEFAPRVGKRRSKAEIAMHEKELQLGRLLTPEEKGESQAHTEVDEATEEKAKEDAKNKIRIDKMAEEGAAAAKAELAEEAKAESTGTDTPAEAGEAPEEEPEATEPALGAEDTGTDTVMPGDEGPQTPKAENLDVESLFS